MMIVAIVAIVASAGEIGPPALGDPARSWGDAQGREPDITWILRWLSCPIAATLWP